MSALTSKETKDGGRLTRQFFKGTRATSAVVEGFLGAMIEAVYRKDGGGERGIPRGDLVVVTARESVRGEPRLL